MIEALRMFQYLDLKYFIFTIVSELVGGGGWKTVSRRGQQCYKHFIWVFPFSVHFALKNQVIMCFLSLLP